MGRAGQADSGPDGGDAPLLRTEVTGQHAALEIFSLGGLRASLHQELETSAPGRTALWTWPCRWGQHP